MTELPKKEEHPPAQAKGGTRPVLRALRSLGGRATVGDVAAATGLVRDRAEAALRELLEERRGHLEVGESGTLVYRFDERFIRRDAEPAWERVKRVAWDGFKVAFKIWIAAMLVIYFVLFVLLLLAALFKSDSDDFDFGGRGHGRRHRGGGFPSFWFWYLMWSPDWYWGRRYYGHRWEEREKVRVPFWKKVFAFVFGPDRPRPTQAQKDRSVLRLIRARRGVLTASELVEHSGLTRYAAEEEMARLMVAHEGDARVSPEGEVVYVFPELMVSAHGRVREREPSPAWRRLESKLALTGNSRGTDLAIGGINAFNLVAAATAPLFIFPRLGFSGPGAWVFLVWIPVVFSTMFFGIPAFRWWSVAKENARRALRNLRKTVLGFVYHASLAGDGPGTVRPDRVAENVREVLPDAAGAHLTPRVDGELVRLTAEFDGEVSVADDGVAEYRFPGIRRQYRAAEATRRELSLEASEVGDIVYASDDSVEEQGRRDLATFDRALGESSDASGEALERGGAPTRYLPPPDRVAYLDDYELVAFEEEMKRRKERVTAPR